MRCWPSPPRKAEFRSLPTMTSLRRALLYGFLVWLIPFAISVCLFGIRKANRPLFESIMEVVLAVCAATFLNLYFRRVERRFVAEGAMLGLLWCAMSILFAWCARWCTSRATWTSRFPWRTWPGWHWAALIAPSRGRSDTAPPCGNCHQSLLLAAVCISTGDF